MCFFLASHPLFAQAHAYSLCICWALAMHLFPSFDTLQPFVVCTSDRWRGKQVWDGDVRLWRTADCKLASKGGSFFKYKHKHKYKYKASLQAREAVFSRGWKWWGVILSWSTSKSASVPNLTATRAPQSLSSLALNGAHKSSLTSVTFQAGW